MTKHTPGPWRFTGVKTWSPPIQEYKEGHDAIWSDSENKYVMYAQDCEDYMATFEFSNEADKALILAAPDLLAAANAAIVLLRTHGLDAGQVGASLEIAIAKATGEPA